MASHAAFGPPGDGRAEGLFLARVAAGALGAAAALAPEPRAIAGAAALIVTAAWILPPGPARAAVVTGLLVATLALAAFLRWRGIGGDAKELGPETTVPFFLGAQFLLRSPLILSPMDARTLVALFALPAAGAIATSLLARRFGVRALIAGLVAASLEPGFNVAVVLALVALAAGMWLAEASHPLWQRGVALAVLVAPLAWDWRSGLIAALCGAALSAHETRGRLGPSVSIGLGVTGLAAALAMAPPQTFASMSALLTLGAAIVPSLVVALIGLRPLAIAAALLAGAAAHAIGGSVALVAPLALASLVIPREGSRIDWAGVVARWQLAWSSALLVLTAALATYPWLRHDALAQAVAELGLVHHPEIPLLFLVAALALSRSRAASRIVAWSPLLLAASVFLIPNLGAPRDLTTGEGGIVLLDAAHPQWAAEVEPGATAATLRLESTLLNAATLPAGSVVAAIQVEFADGSHRDLSVRSGEHTGEWAAERPDLKALGATAPPAWVSWIASDPAPFFGQSYRAQWSLPTSAPVRALELVRDASLPAAVDLQIYAVELRP